MAAVYLTVRVLHVFLGAFWAGALFFVVLYLNPAVAQSGPAGGQVMGQVLRRGWMKAIMLISTLTIVTGLYLFWYMSAGFSSGFMGTKPGIVLSVGMLVGLVALAIGLFGTRPTGNRMAELMAQTAAAQGPPSPEIMAEMGQLSKKMTTLLKIVAVLVFVAVVTMALGPHL